MRKLLIILCFFISSCASVPSNHKHSTYVCSFGNISLTIVATSMDKAAEITATVMERIKSHFTNADTNLLITCRDLE